MGLFARKAKWILIMACLLMAFCFTQRIMNIPVVYPAYSSVQGETGNSETGYTAASCDLSAKSLHPADIMIDDVIPFLILLMVLTLTACRLMIARLPHKQTFCSPQRRHLILCVFRE